MEKLATSLILEQVEEDYLAFYEVAWSIATRAPGADADSILNAAIAAARELVYAGRVAVLRSDGVSPTGSALPAEEALSAIEEKSNWSEPSAQSGESHWFTVTD